VTDRSSPWLTAKGALRVPEITALFWVIKAFTTALGEATSDFMVHVMNPVLAVFLGFVAFVGALVLQFRAGRYLAWTYWFTVAMVGIFGTMAADVLHVQFHLAYAVTTVLYAVILIAVFTSWQLTERTLSFHSVDTVRREAFYWAAVGATFAMGTAVGDFTAYTLKLGYFPSAVVFAGIIAIPAIGYRWRHWNAVLTFWWAYVMTRPLGASVADGLGKAKRTSGLGYGDGKVAIVFAALIVVMVAYLAMAQPDVEEAPAAA
jgi:uncharacterized membrane-anchored protein